MTSLGSDLAHWPIHEPVKRSFVTYNFFPPIFPHSCLAHAACCQQAFRRLSRDLQSGHYRSQVREKKRPNAETQKGVWERLKFSHYNLLPIKDWLTDWPNRKSNWLFGRFILYVFMTKKNFVFFTPLFNSEVSEITDLFKETKITGGAGLFDPSPVYFCMIRANIMQMM